jgi:hypothetical protein
MIELWAFYKTLLVANYVLGAVEMIARGGFYG